MNKIPTTTTTSTHTKRQQQPKTIWSDRFYSRHWNFQYCSLCSQSTRFTRWLRENESGRYIVSCCVFSKVSYKWIRKETITHNRSTCTQIPLLYALCDAYYYIDRYQFLWAKNIAFYQFPVLPIKMLLNCFKQMRARFVVVMSYKLIWLRETVSTKLHIYSF